MSLTNDRLLRALKCQPVDRTPLWLMRQAGRYLPEYRELRQKSGSFLALCQNPKRACEIALQPLKRFDLDAAILFADILTIPDAMGMELQFHAAKGPQFAFAIRDQKSFARLKPLKIEQDLAYVCESVRTIRHALNNQVPLIGFSGSPWTLACYMISGGASHDFNSARQMLYQAPRLVQQLLDLLTETVTAYLNAQILAGAQVIQIFDTWGGLLSTTNYLNYSLASIKKVINGLIHEHQKQSIPIIVFTKQGGQWLTEQLSCQADAYALDWTTELSLARHITQGQAALQGNLDPAILLTKPAIIEQEVARILDNFGIGNGHVFNLGHGILPTTPIANVNALVEAVKRLSRPYH